MVHSQIIIRLWPTFTNLYYLNQVKTRLLYLKTHLTFDIRLGIQLDIRLGSSNSTSIRQFYYLASTWLRSPTFSIRLDDESPVRTPLRRYLHRTFQSWTKCDITICPSYFGQKIWRGALLGSLWGLLLSISFGTCHSLHQWFILVFTL